MQCVIWRESPRSQMLRWPNALEFTIDHDGHPGAQHFTLGHAVCGQQDGLPRVDRTLDDFPQKTSRLWIHTSGGFVLCGRVVDGQVCVCVCV